MSLCIVGQTLGCAKPLPLISYLYENTSYQFVTHIAAVAGVVSRNIDVGRGTIDYTTGISRADNLTGIARCINIGVGHAAIGDICRVGKHSDDTAHLGTLGRAVGLAADCGFICASGVTWFSM